MALTRWAPWQGLFDIQRDMDLLMRRMFDSTDFGGHTPAIGARRWVPAVDVLQRDGDLVIRAELPGIDPERDVEITLQENVLTIRGERRYEDHGNGNGVHRYESAYGTFQRSVLLPKGVTEKDINATYENGILELVVPGAVELAQGRRIPVQIGSGRKALTTKGRKAS